MNGAAASCIPALDMITRIMSELALDDDEGNSFVRHLDSVSVPELVRREATSHTGERGGSTQLLTRGRGFPAPAPCLAADYAQQSTDG